jgi:GT2 family glycosyltransferase
VLPAAVRRGAAANFNRVVQAARAPVVKLMCQDDRLYADCLTKQLAALREHEAVGVVLVSCRRDIVDDRGRVVYPARGWKHASGVDDTPRVLRSVVRAGTNIIGEPSAVLFSKKAFERANGFDETHQYLVDLDLWLRMLDDGALAFIPDALCTFRVSSSSWSSQLARSQAREARRTLRMARAAHPDVVTRIDLARGYGKPTALMLARRAFFSMSNHLPERGDHVDARPAANAVLTADR